MDNRDETGVHPREISLERQRELSELVFRAREQIEAGVAPHERVYALNLFIQGSKFARVDADGDAAG